MKNFTILFRLSLFFILPVVKFINLSLGTIVSSGSSFFNEVLSLKYGIASFTSSCNNSEANSYIDDRTLIFLSEYRL